MKKTRIPARSAAQVAMSKTNPAEPEEATDQPQRRVISGPPRFDQLQGAVGSCCRHCGRGIREHQPGTGLCNPDDAVQHNAEQEAIEQEELEVSQHQEEPIVHPRAARKIEIVGEEEFIPADTDRIEIVEQALELLQILPDCPERDTLARQCAVMVSMKMTTVGYVVTEGQREN